MFSKYLSSVEWFEYFGIATMVLCFISFAIMMIWVFKLDKKKLEEQKNLPLND